MKEYAQQPESKSRTLDSNLRRCRQAPISEILQTYTNNILGREYIQHGSVADEVSLQTRTSRQAPLSVIIQRYIQKENDEFIQGKFETAQRKEMNGNELAESKPKLVIPTEQEPVQREEKPNNTGLPDNIKTGIENLSGYSMDDVKVHYNSDKPAQLNALAYAQGTEIHVAPGQEKHLTHEAWHVVQQMQGRVQPTKQLQGLNVNDCAGLESEADMMGDKSVNYSRKNISEYLNEKTSSQRKIQLKKLQKKPIEHYNNTYFKFVENRPEITQDLSNNKNKETLKSQPIQPRILQLDVIREEGFFYSTIDIYKTPYTDYEDAQQVDEVLDYLTRIFQQINLGVGRMDAADRARIGSMVEGTWPSWVPLAARTNKYVSEYFKAILYKKAIKEKYWKQQQTLLDITKALSKEGYTNAISVYNSYANATDGMRAGYEAQLTQHRDEMITWQLEEIEPHYMSSQGDTGRRADSLLIARETQPTQPQFFPPQNETHTAMLIDHKLGYRTEETAKYLAPSVMHAAKVAPVFYYGDALPTTVKFNFPSGVSDAATNVIKKEAEKARQDRPTSFPGGLQINLNVVLSHISKDDLLKRLCGCETSTNEEAVAKIHRVVNGFLFTEGVKTQVGSELGYFDSLSDWFNDISQSVEQWLSREEIYRLCQRA